MTMITICLIRDELSRVISVIEKNVASARKWRALTSVENGSAEMVHGIEETPANSASFPKGIVWIIP